LPRIAGGGAKLKLKNRRCKILSCMLYQSLFKSHISYHKSNSMFKFLIVDSVARDSPRIAWGGVKVKLKNQRCKILSCKRYQSMLRCADIVPTKNPIPCSNFSMLIPMQETN
jgi:uncharacterized protein (UPF0179 family)